MTPHRRNVILFLVLMLIEIAILLGMFTMLSYSHTH